MNKRQTKKNDKTLVVKSIACLKKLSTKKHYVRVKAHDGFPETLYYWTKTPSKPDSSGVIIQPA